MIEGVDGKRLQANRRRARSDCCRTMPPRNSQVMQNVFSAEFGHSSGGQFNVILKTGSNTFHGSAYEYFENRNLNAIDQQFTNSGITGKPRFDQNRAGGHVSVRSHYPPQQTFLLRQLRIQSARPINYAGENLSPTAAGFATLASLPGLSATDLAVFKKYVPVAATALADTTRYPIVAGVPVQVRLSSVLAPNYQNSYAGVASGDYNISSTDQLQVRYVYNRLATVDAMRRVCPCSLSRSRADTTSPPFPSITTSRRR